MKSFYGHIPFLLVLAGILWFGHVQAQTAVEMGISNCGSCQAGGPDDGVGTGAQPGGGMAAPGRGGGDGGGDDKGKDPGSEPGQGGGNEFGNYYQTISSCPVLTSQLVQGVSDATVGGRQVSALQQFLSQRYSEPQLSGGFFGPLTRSYVIRFQQEQGLPAIGEVGPQTRARIQAVCGQTSGKVTGTVVGGVCTLSSGPSGSCDITAYWNATGRAVHVNLVPPSGSGQEYNWSRLYFGYPNGTPATMRTPITKFTIPGKWQIKLYDAGTNTLLDTDTIKVNPAGTAVEGTITAGDCTLDEGKCNVAASWKASVAKVDVKLVPPGGKEYSWSSLNSEWANGAPATISTTIHSFTTPGTWQIKLYEFGTSRVIDTDTIQIRGTATTSETQVAPCVRGTGCGRDQSTTQAAALVTGKLTAKGCTAGIDRSATDPRNTFICDSSVSWTTNNAQSAYVVISGAAPYDTASFPYGAVAGKNTSGSRVKFWTKEGTYTATLYVDGVPPTQTRAGTGQPVDSVNFTVKSKMTPNAPGSVVDGSVTVETCTVGLNKSTTDPNNALTCDAKVTWSTENANNAYVVISGDFPYNTQYFPHGYLAGSDEIGSHVFWVTSGNYTAKLYVNGTRTSNAEPGTGILVDTQNFTIDPPVTSKNESLGQMANVLEAIRSLLKGWR